MSARATRRLLFVALLLFAPTLVFATMTFATIPVGAWLVWTAGTLRGRPDGPGAPVVVAQVLAWAGVWWLVARRVTRTTQRAPLERRKAAAIAVAVLTAAVGVLPVYGWAFGGGAVAGASFRSAYHAYAEVVSDVLGLGVTFY